MEIPFTKMHGLGNDFIVIYEPKPLFASDSDRAGFAKKFCRRQFSVGADGVLFINPSEKADFRMRVFNSDGSEAENCVNGLRCVSFMKYLLDGEKKDSFTVETLGGIVHSKVKTIGEKAAEVEIEILVQPKLKKKNSIEINDKALDYFFVVVGNPHAVIFTDKKVGDIDVEGIGHAVEYHDRFQPDRTNTEFANIISPTEARMRVHERGACETQACGSGSIAVAFTAAKEGLMEKEKWLSVIQPGGTLKISVGEKLLLKGLAEITYHSKVMYK